LFALLRIVIERWNLNMEYVPQLGEGSKKITPLEELGAILGAQITADNALNLIHGFTELYRGILQGCEDSSARKNFLAIVSSCFKGKIEKLLKSLPADTTKEDLKKLKKEVLGSPICTGGKRFVFRRTEIAKSVEAAFNEEIATRRTSTQQGPSPASPPPSAAAQ
jgi:hypothetical protein